MKTLNVHHETRYRYHGQVQHAYHLACLKPLKSPQQDLLHHELYIDPIPDSRSQHLDCFGNTVECFSFHRDHKHLQVTASSTVKRKCSLPDDPGMQDVAWRDLQNALSYRAGGGYVCAAEFKYESPFVPFLDLVKCYAEEVFHEVPGLIEASLRLSQRIHQEFSYLPQSTEIATPLDAVFRMKKGVCQDFSHLMIGAIRSLGLSARYVSGYLLTQPVPGQVKRRGVDASHAWVAVYCPGLDYPWLELDPTNDSIVAEDYVVLAYGRDFGDVSPLRGVIHAAGGHDLEVGVTVEPSKPHPHDSTCALADDSPNDVRENA
jgi:transglutaminase-like putative cysteine protease